MISQYAILPSRVKAVVIDGLLVVAAMYATSEILSQFEGVPNNIRVVCFVIIFLLYDPLFTSIYGGTIGHSFSKITVKLDKDRSKNISFLAAVVRFLLKTVLGWVSLITITSSDKRQAIHDLVAKSVVLELAD